MALCGMLLPVVSCIRSDYDPGRCQRHIRIVPRWENTTPRSGVAHLDITAENGAERDTVSTSTGIDVDMQPVNYHIVGWEPSPNITVDDRTITVASTTEGAAAEPEIFAGGITDTDVREIPFSRNEVEIIEVPMRQQARELIITVTVRGDADREITAMGGTLSGIALSRDITNGFPPLGDDVTPPALSSGTMQFEFGEDPEYTGSGRKFKSSKMLIGMNGNSTQTLYLTVSYGYNPPRREQYVLGVSHGLVGFHRDQVAVPWLLPLELNLEDQAVFDIIDWEVGPVTEIDAQ